MYQKDQKGDEREGTVETNKGKKAVERHDRP